MAHEYGHHLLKHGQPSTSQAIDVIENEFDADRFARAVCIPIGINSKPPNLYTGSGLGAVIILSATEMVKQARSILSTNKETKLESETHPSTNERLKRIAALDLSAPEDYRMAYADLCNSFREILADLWNELKPTFHELHQSGIRPVRDGALSSEWLPLAP